MVDTVTGFVDVNGEFTLPVTYPTLPGSYTIATNLLKMDGTPITPGVSQPFVVAAPSSPTITAPTSGAATTLTNG